MTTVAQVTALVDAHVSRDHARFRAITLQIAANLSSKSERGADQLRKLVEHPQAVAFVPLPSANGLLSAPPELSSLDDMVLSPSVLDRLSRVVLEYGQRDILHVHSLRPARKLLFTGPPGCIADEMHVPYMTVDANGHRQNHKGGTIERLYHRFNGLPMAGKGNGIRKETLGSRYFVGAMNEDGKIFNREIEAVLWSGIKECVRVRTVSGREIVCTPDHPFATVTGFRPVETIGEGGTILMHQNVRWRSDNGRTLNTSSRPHVYVKHHPYARTKIVRTSSGDYEYKRLTRARAVYEAHLNGLPLQSFVARLNDGVLDGLLFSKPDVDIHHADENPLNDVPDNLVAITHAEHAREHVIDEEGKPNISAYLAVEDTIETIKTVGPRETYDIRMKARPGEPRNFVCGEGFIVHNTGKTMAAGAIARAVNLPMFRAELHGVIGSHLGETAGNLAKVFAHVRDMPAVYLFDEFDAIGMDRSMADGSSAGAEMRRVVNSLLQFIEDDRSESLIVGATNYEQSLDRAIFRRFDEVVAFAPPSEEELIELVRRSLVDVDVDHLDLAEIYAAVARSKLGHADVCAALDRVLKDRVLSGVSIDTARILDGLSRRVRSIYVEVIA